MVLAIRARPAKASRRMSRSRSTWTTSTMRSSSWRSTRTSWSTCMPFVTRCTVQWCRTRSTWLAGLTWSPKTSWTSSTLSWLILTSPSGRSREELYFLYLPVIQLRARNHPVRIKHRRLKVLYFTGRARLRMCSSRTLRAPWRMETIQIHSLNSSFGRTKVITWTPSANSWALSRSKKFSSSSSRTSLLIPDLSVSCRRK